VFKIEQHKIVYIGVTQNIDNTLLISAFKKFLVEVLNLIGNLTSNILLTGLYQELQNFSTQGSLQVKIETDEISYVTPVIPRILTHISNLDEILGGGLPEGTITILAGPPGTGKTILSQQICITNATPDKRVLFFQTLSETTAKTLKYLSQFNFFDQSKISNGSIEFIDLGGILKIQNVQEGIDLVLEHVKRVKPTFVVIDSFKVFEELATSREELRKFTYELIVHLMAWECTTLLLGEFNKQDIDTNPLFSIADGVIRVSVRQESGEEQRFIQVVKMRGTNHSRDEHTISISENGISVYAPRVTIRREMEAARTGHLLTPTRAKLGISKIDELLGTGVPHGSSFLISGVAGTGKTLLSLEFIYRGAKEYGEKGIYFSFEETEDRLRAEARAMGWKMDELVEAGMVEIIFTAQPDIIVEKHLLMISERINKLQAKRIVIDSISLFVHKITDQQIVREKIFQLATLVQKAQGIGFFVTDVPYGSNKLSRFGVEETVVDGVILLTASENEFERDRFIEIYKLRNTSHQNGRHKMEITSNGIFITPREIPVLQTKTRLHELLEKQLQ
jgi:circadian clock protein KaiC